MDSQAKFGNIINIDIVLKFFIFIFIIGLVSGPFIPDLIVTGTSIFFLYFMIKNKLFSQITNNKIIIFLITFYIYLVFNSLFSFDILISLKSTLPYIRFILFILAISYIFKKEDYRIFALYIFLILYTFLCIDVIFQVINGHNLFNYKLVQDHRASSVFGEELILGSFTARTFGIFLILLFFTNIKRKLLLYFYSVAICTCIVIISSERASLLILLIILFFSIFFFSLKKKIIIISLLAICFTFSFAIQKNSYERIINHTLEQLTENDKLNIFSFRHQLHFITAYEIFKDNIFLGGGVKSFRYLCSEKKYVTIIQDIILNTRKYEIRAPYDGILVESEIFDDPDFNRIFMFYPIHADDEFELNTRPSDIQDLVSNNRKYSTIYVKNVNDQHFVKSYYQVIKPIDLLKKNGTIIKKNEIILIYYEYKTGCNTHPHNFYIQFLSEIGLIGFLFLIAIYLIIVILLFKSILLNNIKEKKEEFMLMTIYFAILFPLMPSGNFFNNYLSILIFLPLGFLNIWKTKL